MKNLTLSRPLLIFDLETTGVDPLRDKIVEIAVLRVAPDGSREMRCRRVNPERPIPAGASAVHGIYDQDVAQEPTFRQIARSLLDWIGEADMAGFNVRRFDVVMLDREFADCDLDLGLSQRRIVDAMTIYHQKERRDLSAAVRFYLDRELEGAHSAAADVEATAEVLDAQLARYDDLPRTVEELDALLTGGRDAVDHAGKFRWQGGVVVVGFGKHQGRPLSELVDQAPDYLQWVIGSDFPADAKELVRRALDGDYPTREERPSGG